MDKSILKERALNMRINPTKAEKRFAELLEMNNIPFKQQYVIGNYIADFVVNKTVIELDGSSHLGREEYDQIRDSNIRSLGFKVISC
jgi:very-short-patch-repair endonuclease